MPKTGRQPLLDHPYFTEVLALQKGGNPCVRQIASEEPGTRQAFLKLVASGFYPISLTSPPAFKRVAELSDSPETRRLAQYIHETELGAHPLIGNGAPYQGIAHSELFRTMMESLEEGFEIEFAPCWVLLDRLAIFKATLTQALAFCEVIETIAPEVIFRLGEFVAQWQVLTGRPGSKINRVYLNEHELTEGDAHPEQHIPIVRRMLEPHRALVETPEYADARVAYNNEVVRHLECRVGEILSMQMTLRK